MLKKKTKPINLLWTGGWDSTYRLIQLVLLHKKVVQPYYIIDPDRNSILYEFRAMEKIKSALITKDSKIATLILPTIIKSLIDIQEDKNIILSYFRLTKIESIATQYEWLALFCNQEEISDMEICNEKAIYDVDNRTRKLLNNDLDRIETDYGYYYQLNKKAIGKDIFNVYGNFRFPIFDYTKLEMHIESVEKGFEDVLKLTWFCLMPTKFSNPCGKCHPCRAVFREGLKWRLPLMAKLRYYIWPTLRKVAKILGIYNKLN